VTLPPLVAGSASIGNVGVIGPITIANPGTLVSPSSVTVANLPVTQAVSGTVTVANPGTLGGTVGVSSLPALPAGANTIGSVAIVGTVPVSLTASGTQSVVGTITVANPSVAPSTVTIANLPALQAVSGTVTIANPGTTATSVTVANLPSVQAISGTVALAGTQAVSGAVTIANTAAVSGSVSVTGTAAVAGSVTVTSVPNAGLGAMQTIAASSTNGAALGTLPTGGSGVRIYLPVGASLTYTIATTAPTSAPASQFSLSNAANGYNWDEPLSGGAMIYVTAVSVAGSGSAAPLFRWL
jgi:hypothetical protein